MLPNISVPKRKQKRRRCQLIWSFQPFLALLDLPSRTESFGHVNAADLEFLFSPGRGGSHFALCESNHTSSSSTERFTLKKLKGFRFTLIHPVTDRASVAVKNVCLARKAPRQSEGSNISFNML